MYFQIFDRADFERSGAWVMAGGQRVDTGALTVWYQDEQVVAVDMTGYAFPEGFEAFLEQYQAENPYRREDYDYSWLLSRSEARRQPVEFLFLTQDGKSHG